MNVKAEYSFFLLGNSQNVLGLLSIVNSTVDTALKNIIWDIEYCLILLQLNWGETIGLKKISLSF